jgi:hypothetical protein
VNKLEMLEEFDKANNGTYTINDLAELIVEAYELGCDTEYEKIERVREVIEKHWNENICSLSTYQEIIKALDGEQ